MDQMQIKFSYNWQPVLLREKVEYLFPSSITPYMRAKYKGPAVFRWDIYNKNPEDKKTIYIGDTQELCPKRLYGILNPGPTQLNNQRANKDFRGFLKDKLSIRLDFCNIQDFIVGQTSLEIGSLSDRSIRRLIAESLIIEYRQRGFTVVDI
jgi:hypothetical protein